VTEQIPTALAGRYRRLRAGSIGLNRPQDVQAVRITKEMRASILAGQPLMEESGRYGDYSEGARGGRAGLPGRSVDPQGEGDRQPAVGAGPGGAAALAGGHLPAGDLERRAVAALERGAPIATVLGRSDIGAIVTRREDPTPYLVSTGMPPLAAGANRRLGLGLQARVHHRLVFQQGYAFTGLAPRNP